MDEKKEYAQNHLKSHLCELVRSYYRGQEYIKRWRAEFLGNKDYLDTVYIDQSEPIYVEFDDDGNLNISLMCRSMGWGMMWHSMLTQEQLAECSNANAALTLLPHLIFVRTDLPEKTVPHGGSQYSVPTALIRKCHFIADIFKSLLEDIESED